MEKFKGTPGPWRVSDDNYTFQHVAHDFYHQISAGSGYLNEMKGVGFSLSGPMSIHDANLIAAAPELLEALQELISGYEDREHLGMFDMLVHGDLIQKANAAINKALGE